MTIGHLSINGFRNLDCVDMPLHTNVTIIHGENGSGKTSILEALYYLVYGKSFRTSSPLPILQQGKDEMLLRLFLELEEKKHQLAMSRNVESTQIRLNRVPVKKRSDIVKLLPVQFFDATTYRHLASGPKYRREFLDWGVFHVKHRFKNAISAYKKAHVARNKLLKMRAPLTQIKPWSETMAQMSEVIHEERSTFFELLHERFQSLWSSLGHAEQNIELKYQKGWAGDDLLAAFSDSYEYDCRMGYTTTGPHRADLEIFASGHHAFDWLSQGQQKTLAYSLYLAQLLVLEDQKESRGIFLLDDLPAELDAQRQMHLVEALLSIGSQLIVTGIREDDLRHIFSSVDCMSYAVNNGQLEQM